MADPASRLLNLLSLLQTPREWAGAELAGRLRVSARTVRRDIDRLRELGYPVQAARGPDGGYRLVAGTAMPPLLLDDEEAVAIAVGLRTAAAQPVDGIGEASARALAKLEQVLPSRLRRRVAALGTATLPLTTPGGAAVDPACLAVLAAAAAGGERVRFTYRPAGRAGGTGGDAHGGARRHTEPHRIVAAGRRWYLIAYDLDRGDWRTFRADRVSEPRPTGQRATPRDVPGGDAAAFLRDSLYSLAPAYRAEVTLHLPAGDAAARLGIDPGAVRALDGGHCLLTTHADTLEWLAARLLMLGCDLHVHGPPELRDHLTALAARAARAAAP
ncbi:WYL domain-containing protein [Actinomadura darangshiensis]|uniref:WYL domain-containing protein n=1 Tax=Actinomadura darangshiensis TaxID=705336 RepID=A0A4R5A232_9ACTN|nr:WYL domain-containing protein [Actinomadura darangshiensis]TDD64856.1 WYL domain-containing protein [Actinomadura darangshiensis]